MVALALESLKVLHFLQLDVVLSTLAIHDLGRQFVPTEEAAMAWDILPFHAITRELPGTDMIPETRKPRCKGYWEKPRYP